MRAILGMAYVLQNSSTFALIINLYEIWVEICNKCSYKTSLVSLVKNSEFQRTKIERNYAGTCTCDAWCNYIYLNDRHICVNAPQTICETHKTRLNAVS